MSVTNYPKLVIDTNKLKNNIEVLKKTCDEVGITVSCVVKGTNGLPVVIETFVDSGVKYLASSRLTQLQRIKSIDKSIHTLALRIPMRSEIDKLVEVADCSLNSDMTTLKILNGKCREKGITHEVILMNDLGDLREGFFETQELIDAAVFVENDCESLYLKGIGTNLGCYGSIEPDQENLGQLIRNAESIEKIIHRRLDWISGGATTSVPMVLNKTIPNRINHLRIGDGIFLRDMEMYFNYRFDEMYDDIFVLAGEVIEIHEKPSYPIGTISVDAFGNKPEYEDIGTRTRALIGMGRQDIGDMTKLIPIDEGQVVIGGSSDHTILDITNSHEKLNVGDIVYFKLQYENLLFSTSSEYVFKEIL